MATQNHKRTNKGFILGLLVFVFLFVISPIKTYSTDTINWTNPNSDGSGPFKLSADNIMKTLIEDGLITQVIGCTGAIDQVAEALFKLEIVGKSLLTRPKATVNILFNEKTRAKVCQSIKGSAETSAGGVINMNLPAGLEQIINCGRYSNEGIDTSTGEKLDEANKENKKSSIVTECLNGIAYTLAKNQLTAMTRSTMNWINAGFDGNPYFVQSTRSVLNSVERNIVEPAIYGLADEAFPYGDTFVLSYVNRFRNRSGLTGDRSLLANLASNMADYIIVDYQNDDSLSPLENKQAMEKKAVEKFSKDFSSGGWDGWAAMILGDQNNPLGFYSAASRVISQEVENATQDVRDEIVDGYMPQKDCVKWQEYDENNEPVKEKKANGIEYYKYYESENRREKGENDVCVKTKTITPASNIEKQAEEFLSTPVRQLELADNITDVLNSVFSVLLYAVQNQGLPGLTSGDYTYTQENTSVSTYSNDIEVDSLLSESNNYTKDSSFDITRDLGNTFIYELYKNPYLGNWDASLNKTSNTPSGTCYSSEGLETTCPTRLMKDVAPNDCLINGNKVPCPANVYYIVTKAGKTDLIRNGYSGWAVGDRAFWDGTSWQNWKKNQSNPIKKRGVLQLQEDYSVVAKEILRALPSIMPAMGKLDYCIPGPNPSFEINSGDAYIALAEIVNSIGADYTPSGDQIQKENRYYFPSDGEELYENYQDVFRDLDGIIVNEIWNKVKETKKWQEIQFPSRIPKLNKKEENTDQDERMDSMISRIASGINSEGGVFFDKYNEIMESPYGFWKNSLLQKEFIEREDTAELEKNPAYMPMMKAGQEITSGMKYYSEEVDTLTDKYNQAVQEADSNIYKLSELKKQVSGIINAAQERRKISMIEKIREEEPGFDEKEFNKRYGECLEEERVKFYDDRDITNGTGEDSEERCSDGIDNDMDGFIDKDDQDCNSKYRRTSEDAIDPESGYGSLASPGTTRRGYNTRTNEEEYEERDEFTDPSVSIIWPGPVCDEENVGKCIVGKPTAVESSSIADSWTCVQEAGGEDEVSCKIMRTITDEDLEEKLEEFKDELLDGDLNIETLKYLIAGYEQKIERAAGDLGLQDTKIMEALDWLMDKVRDGEDSFAVKAVVWVAKRLGNTIDVVKFLVDKLPEIIATLSSLAGATVSLEKLGITDFFKGF